MEFIMGSVAQESYFEGLGVGSGRKAPNLMRSRSWSSTVKLAQYYVKHLEKFPKCV
jgi:hypothetical protein